MFQIIVFPLTTYAAYRSYMTYKPYAGDLPT